MFEDGIINFETSLRGLGTNINIFSVLINSATPVTVTTEYHGFRWFSTMKKMFDASNLTIIKKDKLDNDQIGEIGDLSKAFSPYPVVNTINLFDQTHVIKNNKKPCIGLACYNDSDEVFDNSNFKKGSYLYPKNRWYPVEYWTEVFQYAKKMGYDVITFDSRKVDVQTKIFMLNELCDVVIGYEGGLAHLAHLLKVPVIMLPWHTDSFICDFLHLDSRTYFLNSAEELLTWTPTHFHNILNDLKNDNGNNKILQQQSIDVTADLNHFKIPNASINQYHSLKLTSFERKLIMATHREIKFGGRIPINFVERLI